MKRKLTVELDENTTQVLNVTEAFKGSNKDLEDIAHDLTANHIRCAEIDEKTQRFKDIKPIYKIS